TGETTLANAPPPPPAPEPAPAAPAEGADEKREEAPEAEASGNVEYMKKASRAAGATAKPMPKMPQARAAAPARTVAPGGGAGFGMAANRGESLSAPRRVSALAAVALEAGTTRYGLPRRVTVPDESATMVLLLHERVPGAAVFLFSPDPGVPDSSAHP